MPFPFRYIGDLLQDLDDEGRKSPDKQTPPEEIIEYWFEEHRSLLKESDHDACAILSTLLPETRTDRVYNIQAPRLQTIFVKALRLGASRVMELERWTEPGAGVDLGDCIENTLRRTPNSRDDTTKLTIEEIDEKLVRVAATCRYSSPAIRAKYKHSEDGPHSLLTKIYAQLGSRDAKWFTRLILKNYAPVLLKRVTVYRNYHSLLPQIMDIRNDLSVAIECLRQVDERPEGVDIASILKPCLGTKVGRQQWYKGRSINHCMNMAHGRDIACEQKMDGEYCQIHIDLRKPVNKIQIFSKSGKDSTMDRKQVHEVIRDSLNMGTEDCPFKIGCILEGELLVYSTKEEKILPFHKIRRYVSRSGTFLGTEQDSENHEYEHLMIMYYDVLLIDDESLICVKNSERFERLKEIVTTREGYAELVTRTSISTSEPSAPRILRELFAQCITSRAEGLVLKPDEPYVNLTSQRRPYGCCSIKLKKEYIQGWGDVGDFAVVGATYDAAKARESRIPNVRWTHFYIGCLENGDQARAKTEMPLFRVTNIVELTGPVLSAFWDQGGPVAVPYDDDNSFLLKLSGGIFGKPPTVVFPSPMVFDMRCFSFDREGNTNFWCMRFPQVIKVHYDRSYLDTISFAELQEIAEDTMCASQEDDSQEMRRWIEALEKVDRKCPSQNSALSDVHPSSPPTPFKSDRPRHDSLTPTQSSAIKSGKASQETSQTVPTSNQTKRHPSEEESGTIHNIKRRRGLSDVSSIISSQNTPTNLTPTRTSRREPLVDVDSNSLKTRRPELQHSSSALPLSNSTPQDKEDIPPKKAPSSPASTCYTPSEPGSPPPKDATKSEQLMATTVDQIKEKEIKPCCSLAGDACNLANYSVLLSPCVASYAQVTDELLRQHGINSPLLDPQVWNVKSPVTSPSKDTKNSDSASSPESKRPDRKICLVDSEQQEATEAFLQKIKDADIKRKDGRREWVTVYDWKVLESITAHESKATKSADPWRRFYMGIV